jgi:cell division septal protein FtsQ
MRQSLWDRRLGAGGERRSPFAGLARASSRIVHAPARVEQPRGIERAPRRREPALLFVLAAAFAAGLGGGGQLAEAARYWLSGSAPRLEAIAVRGAEQLAPADVAAATGAPRGVDLRGVQADAVVARLTRHPWIASARAVELPTGRLLVEIVERRAVASVGRPGETRRFAVDASGTPFAPALPAVTDPLPRLAAASPLVLGEPAAELAQALELAGRLEVLGLPRALEIEIAAPGDPTGFALRLEGVAPRVVLGRDAPGARLEALARVLETGLPEAASAGTLDLRFADQVVLRGTPPANGAAAATGPQSDAAASEPGPSGGRDGGNNGG